MEHSEYDDSAIPTNEENAVRKSVAKYAANFRFPADARIAKGILSCGCYRGLNCSDKGLPQ